MQSQLLESNSYWSLVIAVLFLKQNTLVPSAGHYRELKVAGLNPCDASIAFGRSIFCCVLISLFRSSPSMSVDQYLAWLELFQHPEFVALFRCYEHEKTMSITIQWGKNALAPPQIWGGGTFFSGSGPPPFPLPVVCNNTHVNLPPTDQNSPVSTVRSLQVTRIILFNHAVKLSKVVLIMCLTNSLFLMYYL